MQLNTIEYKLLCNANKNTMQIQCNTKTGNNTDTIEYKNLCNANTNTTQYKYNWMKIQLNTNTYAILTNTYAIEYNWIQITMQYK